MSDIWKSSEKWLSSASMYYIAKQKKERGTPGWRGVRFSCSPQYSVWINQLCSTKPRQTNGCMHNSCKESSANQGVDKAVPWYSYSCFILWAHPRTHLPLSCPFYSYRTYRI